MTKAVIKRYFKDEYESLDYTIDYSRELNIRSDDTISTSTWIIPSGTAEAASTIEIDDSNVSYDVDNPSPIFRDTVSDAVTITSTTTTCYISGGTLGQVYTIMNRIVTASGRKYATTFELEIIRRSV